MKLILFLTVFLASFNRLHACTLGNKEKAHECSVVAREIYDCTINTTFSAAKYEADVKKCYTDICEALPAFYIDDQNQADHRFQCDNDIWFVSMKPAMISCQDPKLREVVGDDDDTVKAWIDASFHYGFIAYMRYAYLLGKPNDTTTVSRIPDLIFTRTIASTCGCDKVQEMQECIKQVKIRATEEYKAYMEHFDQCFKDNNKCSAQFDTLNQIHCDCDRVSMEIKRDWIKNGGNSCGLKYFPNQKDVPTRIMKANSECYNSTMKQDIDFWWNAEPC